MLYLVPYQLWYMTLHSILFTDFSPVAKQTWREDTTIKRMQRICGTEALPWFIVLWTTASCLSVSCCFFCPLHLYTDCMLHVEVIWPVTMLDGTFSVVQSDKSNKYICTSLVKCSLKMWGNELNVNMPLGWSQEYKVQYTEILSHFHNMK